MSLFAYSVNRFVMTPTSTLDEVLEFAYRICVIRFGFIYTVIDNMASKAKPFLAFIRFAMELVSYSMYCILYAVSSVYNKARTKSPVNKALLGRILWKQKLSNFHNAIPRDFLCVNFTSVQPEYVLRPNVSLYSVTEKEAIFVETPTDVNIYSSDAFPFFYVGQFIYSTKVIKITIECFHSLAEEVGNPAVHVVWLSNTGRCGSTMVNQVFESVEGTLVMAEPDALQNVFYLLQYSDISVEGYNRMLMSTVRLLCKPRPGTERIFITLRSSCTALMADISMLFPDIKQMFMYRNCLDTVSSFANALASFPYGLVLRSCSNNEILSTVLPVFRQMLRFHIGTKRKGAQEVPLNVNPIGILTYLWAEQIKVAQDAISRNQNILPVRYEDIVSKPVETIRLIFENKGIDLKYLSKAVSSLSKDSQRETVLSRSRIGNQGRNIALADRIKADAILASYNLPLMGKELVL